MHMFVEVHHLEAIELIRDRLDLLYLIGWRILNAFRIPLDVCSGRFLVLPTSFDCATRDFSIVDVFNLVVAHRACYNLGAVHVEKKCRGKLEQLYSLYLESWRHLKV